MKLGIAYSEKRQVGKQRWELADKLVYGGLEEPALFAERFYVRVEQEPEVEQARHVVVKGDGAEWIRQAAEQVFPRHIFQLDRWHLLARIEQFAGHLSRLWLRVIAYNLGNLWRRLAVPRRMGNWSLTSLQQRLLKTGGRLVKHTRYFWLLLAEWHLRRRLLGSMLKMIGALALPDVYQNGREGNLFRSHPVGTSVNLNPAGKTHGI